MTALVIPKGFLCDFHGRHLIQKDTRLGDGSLLTAEYMYRVLEDPRFYEMVGGSLANKTRVSYWLNKILPACCWLSPDARLKAYNAAIGLWPSEALGGMMQMYIGIDKLGAIEFNIPDPEFESLSPSEISRKYLEPMFMKLKEAYVEKQKVGTDCSVIPDDTITRPGPVGSA